MKLYTVKVETEVVVVAEDEEGAERAAHEAFDDMSSFDRELDVSPLRYLPFGWNGKELPFVDPDGDTPEMDINGWIKGGAAPEMDSRLAARAAGTKRLDQGGK